MSRGRRRPPRPVGLDRITGHGGDDVAGAHDKGAARRWNDDPGAESARLGRAAVALACAGAGIGLVWGLSWVLWALSGAGPSVPVTGILGGVLVGMLAGLGVAAVLLVPVLVAAALGGRRLAGRRRAQRLWGGGVGLLAGFLRLWGAVLVLASWGQVAQFTWPAWVLAVAAGALVTPWVIDGRAGRSSPLR
ncbi:hypothetical protein [Cutibacterium avidum]|uniref:hypothetical protein n=1 Tax=Cutibacterium avidum TaxID=33010 RepID=UPI00083E88D9|nr:hypothetical protein [Cutibacterium avidum]AOG28014.1 hypothetical protein BFS79_05175 [Cutibacterium avidum]